jgi:hypothetical protein
MAARSYLSLRAARQNICAIFLIPEGKQKEGKVGFRSPHAKLCTDVARKSGGAAMRPELFLPYFS